MKSSEEFQKGGDVPGRIVDGADPDNTLYNQPEDPGLNAVSEGFRHFGYKDDDEINAVEWIVYDAFEDKKLASGTPGVGKKGNYVHSAKNTAYSEKKYSVSPIDILIPKMI